MSASQSGGTGGTHPPMEALVAHRGNMLLVERVIACGPEGIRVQARTDPGAWYADGEGAMPAWIGIELMAQAIAALVGLTAREQGAAPKRGLLLGTRSFTARLPAFPGGQTLVVTAKEVFQEANGLAAFDAGIEMAGSVVAEATLKVFEPADFESFMEQAR